LSAVLETPAVDAYGPPPSPFTISEGNDMYHKLMHDTIPDLLALKHQPLKLYLALTQFANITTGECYPGYARLRKMCKIYSGSEMKHAIDTLVEAGLIATWMNGNKRHYQVL
jgi:hypothetical protein